MWLLGTNNAVMQYFPAPQDVPGGYAILSHIWDASEDNFQDMMKLREEHKAGLLPPDPLSRVRAKTRKACELARVLGFQYIWIDNCCGERSHVAALSKDIQSQFLYFSLAHVCLVYLHDVRSGHDPTLTLPPFRASKWHTSPWSLQELIAPDMVIFYSKDWEMIGTKQSLAPILEQITAIPATVLTFDKAHSSFSVAARMLWASRRSPNIARQEEQAHSLVGIMGVTMDVLSGPGEGRRAFQRLQEEIIKQLADTTVFAWGNMRPLSFTQVTKLVQDLPSQPTGTVHTHHAMESFLFAPGPSAFTSHFATARTLSRLPIGDTAYDLDTSDLLTFTVTSNGPIRARLPVFELSQQRVLIAFISCSIDDKPLGLVLRWCPNSSGGFPLYDVGIQIHHPDGTGIVRLVTLDDVRYTTVFTWRTIDIRGQHDHSPSQSFQRIPMNRDLSSFYIERNLLEKFGGRCLPRNPVVSTAPSPAGQKESFLMGLATSLKSSVVDAFSTMASLGKDSLPQTRELLPATFLFFVDNTPVRQHPFLVHFGRCKYTAVDGSDGGSGALWANAELFDGDMERVEFQPAIPKHACSEDHISNWRDRQKTFQIEFNALTCGVVLSFRSSEAFGTGTKVFIPDITISYMR